MAEHTANKGVSINVEMSAGNLTHDQASSIEGALIRKKLGEMEGNMILLTLLKISLVNLIY